MPTVINGHLKPPEESGVAASRNRDDSLPSDALYRLDNDSLLELFEYVIACRGLRSLSLTCKWIREACRPTLFSSCQLWMTDKFNARRSIPEMMWPYTCGMVQVPVPLSTGKFDETRKNRNLFLYCNFPYLEYEPPDGYDDVYAPLTTNLSRMPKLQGISIRHYDTGCGIPWEAINAVVQVPQLRFLEFHGRLDHRRTIPPETERSLRLPVHCLTTIDYPTNGYDEVSATEAKIISVLLRQTNTQRSLEALSLPNKCAPLECFCTDKFPRLRQLTLIGRYQLSASHPHPQGCIPHISILVNMPRLQKLVLTLSQPIGLPRQAIWPAGVSAEFPCPELRELSVCHPNPDDEFYAHLPPTLRRLALRCWPRHYQSLLRRDRKKLKRLGWYSPILSSSEMLRILRRCPSRDVRQLDIEFEEDASGGDLFRCIPDVFPQLQYLVLHRYRRAGVDATPVAAIAQALAPLRSLRVFLCNPDFEEAPIIFGADRNPSFAPLIAAFHRAADIFAGALAPSAQAVGFLVRQDISARYFYFRIMRDGDGTARTKDDQYILDKLGISVDEVSSLPHL